MKNIVLCSDGTGNNDIKARGTNVFKLYEAIDIQGHKSDATLTPQVAFYDDGVGTSRLLALKMIGGGFGWGFSKNVKDLYAELAHVYEAGDKIYLFGFSRGAYTVRTLAGLIQHCGILDVRGRTEAEIKTAVASCWKTFHDAAFTDELGDDRRRTKIPADSDRAQAADRRKRLAAVIDDDKAPYGEEGIEFIGVWDTVGALGVPRGWIRDLLNLYYPLKFAELTVGPQIKRACHAIAIDDERLTFQPELWNEDDGKDPRIYQVWFAGVHSNVGGGYPKQGMSLVALDWMMCEAEKCGLRFIEDDRGYANVHQDVNDKLYDSRGGLAVYYRWNPRNIVSLCQEHKMAKPKIHVSVFERIASGTDGYSPGNIPFDCEIVTTAPPRFRNPPPPTWPAQNVLEEIVRGIASSGAGGAGSPMDSMGEAIVSGKKSYRAFILATAIAVLLLLWPNLLALKFILGPLLSRVLIILGFAAAGYKIWRWSDRVDSALTAAYSGWWSGRRQWLREKLLS